MFRRKKKLESFFSNVEILAIILYHGVLSFFFYKKNIWEQKISAFFVIKIFYV